MSPTAERLPRVSVIVPVRDRRDLLRDLLDGLANQTMNDFEVVVVDDGSTDGSWDEAHNAAGRGLLVRVERTTGIGAVAARSVGVASARSDLLAFTDSDCVPDPGWLAAGVAALESGADIVAGATTAARAPDVLERTVYEEVDDGLCATCNVFYRRTAFDAAGGFTEAGRLLGFRFNRRAKKLGFGEDTLLAWRVRRTGRFEFEPRALVRHGVLRPSVREILWRTWVVGAFPTLVREVPELRTLLLRGRMWLGPRRRLPVYALIPAAALPWRIWLLPAVGVWWVAATTITMRRARGSRKRRLLAIPVEMAVDAITAVALVAGSIRARTLVL
ncbi:MAG: glycosyltransferase [Actinomycetota bacterium]